MAINPQAILDKVINIANTDTKVLRDEMNRKIHLVDVSYNALKFSDPTLTKEEHSKLLLALSTALSFRKSLNSVVKELQELKGTRVLQVFFLSDPKFGEFVVGSSYSSVQKRISSILSSIPNISPTLSSVDIGHIPTEGIHAAHSPLNEKLFRIFHSLPIGSPAFFNVASQINELHHLHNISCSYTFDRPNYDVQAFNKILGKVAIVVTIQSKELNNELSQYEKKIGNSIKKIVSSKEFADELLNTPGSNTILEDIRQGLIAVMKGKPFISTHRKKPASTKRKEFSKPNVARITKPDKVPAVRNVQGQFYSLTSLQTLINANLQHVISANMGDQPYPGGQRKILNYRTGRFASSATVQRLTQSREGMITAFYSYMKHPYQTFQPGFAQGSPESRDPKLLISKSIREIAATMVGNRMRAVLI